MSKSWFLAVSFIFFTATAHAGGAIHTNINGLPLHWDTGSDLTYNPDGGVLKNGNPLYDTNAESIALINDAFNAWGALGTDLGITQGAILPEIDVSNFETFLNTGSAECYDSDPGTPCLSPVVFDEDGEILNELFGNCANNSILGFAGPDDIDDGSGNVDQLIIRRGQALFSGHCLDPITVQPGCGSCKRTLTDAEIRSIITHEVGHLMGMDHTQVNPAAYEACVISGACPPEFANAIPTMFPILVAGANMESLHNDDAAYFRRLYGGGPNTCSVSGSVFANDGTTELRGAEVVAKNTDRVLETTDAIAFVSGAEAPRINQFGHSQGNCESNCGDYLITGLSDGETYQLCAQKIKPQFTGGSSIEPVDPPFQAFSDTCPDGLTVTCSCPGGSCADFSGQDIVTDADPASIDEPDEPEQITDPVETSSGGCSLAKPATGAWKFFAKYPATFFLSHR